MYSRNRLVPTYTKSQIAPLENNYNGATPDPGYIPEWRLTLDGLSSGLSVGISTGVTTYRLVLVIAGRGRIGAFALKRAFDSRQLGRLPSWSIGIGIAADAGSRLLGTTSTAARNRTRPRGARQCMELLKNDGSVATFATDRATPTIPFWQMVFKNIRVYFLGSDDFSRDAKMQAARNINSALEAGWTGFEIGERIPLAEIARAHELVDHPARRGRVVVIV